MSSIKDLPVGQPEGRTQETEVDKIEKELLDEIKKTGITQMERGLLDDMRIIYLVMTAQLLGLRQGRDETLKQCQTIEDEKKWTTNEVKMLYDGEFHGIDCMEDEDRYGFFGYYNGDLNHPDFRPSSAIFLNKKDAEHLWNIFKQQLNPVQKEQ